MNKTAAAFLAVAATAAFAGSAQAQVCAGYPTGDRGMYFGARADFPENLRSYGVEANYNFSGPLGVYGGLNVRSLKDDEDLPDDEGGSDDELYAGAAFEVVSLGLMVGPRVSVCPVAELRNIDLGEDNYTEIPVGLGIGASLGIPGIAATGYVQPQAVFSRFDVEGFDAENETHFGIKAGANLGLGLITVGGEVRHLFLDDEEDLTRIIRDETTFGIRVGIRL